MRMRSSDHWRNLRVAKSSHCRCCCGLKCSEAEKCMARFRFNWQGDPHPIALRLRKAQIIRRKLVQQEEEDAFLGSLAEPESSQVFSLWLLLWTELLSSGQMSVWLDTLCPIVSPDQQTDR